MLDFVAPTLDKSLTWMALFLVAFLILTSNDQRKAVLTFLAGAGLGYFLELWGTTRLRGHITRCKPRRCLPSWHMVWRQ